MGSWPLNYNSAGVPKNDKNVRKKEFGSIDIEFDPELNSIDNRDLYNYLACKEKSNITMC